MSETLYKDLIIKTFRDNAIRSVVMIDDQYLRYDELLDRLESGQNDVTEPRIAITKKAAKLHNFFRNEKNILCDIDNGDKSIDVEKIRKSDLVILDYELEINDPKKSIDLIGKLQKNDHMNLVVLYTHANPEEVWLKLASSLRDAKTLESIAASSELSLQELNTAWDDVTDFGAALPNEWSEWITNEDLSEYILTSDLGLATKTKFGIKYKNKGKVFRQLASENLLNKIHPRVGKVEEHGFCFYGKNNTTKWIQTGNVFIVIHQKSIDDSPHEPTELWDALATGLIDWYPSYYQLLISEIQNTLENDGLPFDPSFSNDVDGHAGWLSKILEENDVSLQNGLSKQLIHQLVDDLKIKLSNKKELLAFQSKSISALSLEKNNVQDKSFDEFSASHAKLDVVDKNFSERMHHALNANLCSSSFAGKFITSGTIVKEASLNQEETKWYLCVSPACDTVPAQLKGDLAKRLDPDRLLKFLVLNKISLGSALENATSGRSVFICTDTNKRLAFNVQNDQYAPEVEYALIHDHNGIYENIMTDGVRASFLQRDPEKNASHLKEARLIPISQLRDSYTARYQTVASHHLGRVGVDYFDLKKPALTKAINSPVL